MVVVDFVNMAPKRKLKHHSVLDEQRLLEFFDREGVKPIHAHKIWRHAIVNNGEGRLSDIPG